MTSRGILLDTIVAVLTWCPMCLRKWDSLQFFAASSLKAVFGSLPSHKHIHFKRLTWVSLHTNKTSLNKWQLHQWPSGQAKWLLECCGDVVYGIANDTSNSALNASSFVAGKTLQSLSLERMLRMIRMNDSLLKHCNDGNGENYLGYFQLVHLVTVQYTDHSHVRSKRNCIRSVYIYI